MIISSLDWHHFLTEKEISWTKTRRRKRHSDPLFGRIVE